MSQRGYRIATSSGFTPDEVRLLEQLLSSLRITHARSPLTRHSAYASLCKKSQAMSRALRREQARQRLERVLEKKEP